MLGELLSGLLFLVVYQPGPAWEQGKSTQAQNLREHGRFMLELHQRGAMREAGGFVNADGGAAVLTVESEAEAKQILDTDPAVVSGVMTYSLRQWHPQDWEAIAARVKARQP